MPRSEAGQLPDAGAVSDGLDMLDLTNNFHSSIFAKSSALQTANR